MSFASQLREVALIKSPLIESLKNRMLELAEDRLFKLTLDFEDEDEHDLPNWEYLGGSIPFKYRDLIVNFCQKEKFNYELIGFTRLIINLSNEGQESEDEQSEDKNIESEENEDSNNNSESKKRRK